VRAILPTESFGELLKYLRKRAHLTQRDLAAAVGYTEAHLSRLENNDRLPDVTTIAALFIPALDLKDDPAMMERLLKLAAQARDPHGARAPLGVKIQQVTIEHQVDVDLGALEEIPARPAQFVERPLLGQHIQRLLDSERGVAVCGMAGMGKTSLAASVARTFERGPVFWHTLTPGITASLEAIVRQLALFLFSQGQEQVKPILDLRAQTKPLPLDQQITLLRSALAGQIALLCFDDVHSLAGDEKALAFLGNLRATADVHLLLISREETSLPIPQITLTGLESAETLQLIEQLGLGSNSQLANSLSERTHGNPMLLRLAAGQALSPGADADEFLTHLESQPQVASWLLNSALRDLSPGARWLVEFLSVFRQPVDLQADALFEACEQAGQPVSVEAVREAQRRFLVQDARRAALHPLVRDHIYAELSARPAQRKRLHRLAADWLAADGQILQACVHAVRAGQARQMADILAGREQDIFRRGQALAMADVLGEALDLLRADKRGHADLLRWFHFERGKFLTNSVRSAEAVINFREALALSSTPQLRAEALGQFAELLTARNEYAEVVELCSSALAALSPADQLLDASLKGALAMAYYNLGKFAEARDMAEQSLASTRQFGHAQWRALEVIRARAHFWLANTARIRREPAVAMEHARQGLACARESGTSRLENTLLGFVGGLLYDRGEIEESTVYRLQAMNMAKELGDSYTAAYFNMYLSSHHQIRNELQAALEKLDQARELLEQLGDAHGLADQNSKRSEFLLALGRVDEARATSEKLIRESESISQTRMFGYYLNTLSTILLCCDPPDFASARSTLERALALPAAEKDPMLRFQLNSALAITTLAEGNAEAAQKILDASPVSEGHSLWVRLDRVLVDAYVALGRGEKKRALELSESLLEKAGMHELYRLRVRRLQDAAQNPRPNLFPRAIWMVEP
jgi:ATP/maltotriose-dependent transcriptional regulator MalT/DNA-binding XRE family transcriptional regulator